jgi:hypothetical protein
MRSVSREMKSVSREMRSVSREISPCFTRDRNRLT